MENESPEPEMAGCQPVSPPVDGVSLGWMPWIMSLNALLLLRGAGVLGASLLVSCVTRGFGLGSCFASGEESPLSTAEALVHGSKGVPAGGRTWLLWQWLLP